MGRSDEAEGGRRTVQDIAPTRPLIEIPSCDWSATRAIERVFGLGSAAAQTLVRGGFEDLSQVRARLEDAPLNPPEQLPGAVAAARVIAGHLERQSRIAVHGDYDVDGVCSTSILVRTLSALGADVTWHVPSRFGDGYGLTIASVERLAADGVDLIVAVDCGIGSVEEVERARELGIEVVICDHHTIGERLPEATIVHPGLGGYPDPQLCAAAATHKLADCLVGLLGRDKTELRRDLALVALATVCDMVPLIGENRALVRRGLAEMRQTQRPGLVELMRVAGVDQLKIAAGAFGFGLGPRINAVGRMHSAEPAVELLLTESHPRAAELASGLAAANHQRREIEREVLLVAEAQAAEQADQFAIVVAGEGWHPGVLGIVAGRIADRYRRPAVALGISGGVAAGSGRSGGRYDLHRGLANCSELLDRFGGHRAAAGLALDQSRVGKLRSALAADAAASLTLDDLRPRFRIDAVVGPSAINLSNIADLESLGPFGAGNPSPLLLIAGVRLESVARLGSSGQHFKLTVTAGRARVPVVAFRQERAIVAQSPPATVDLVVELQRNEFNGREEPQAVLRALIESDRSTDSLWLEEFARAASDQPPAGEPEGLDPARGHDRRGRPLAEVLLEFGAGGAPVVVVANDPVSIRELVDGVICDQVTAEVIAYDDPRLETTADRAVVMAEPPPAPRFARFGGTEAIAAWNDDFLAGIGASPEQLLLSREHVVGVFRAIRTGGADITAVAEQIRTVCPNPRLAGRSLRVLEELGLADVERVGVEIVGVEVREIGKVELEQSITFRSYSEYLEESSLWLRQLSEQTRSP